MPRRAVPGRRSRIWTGHRLQMQLCTAAPKTVERSPRPPPRACANHARTHQATADSPSDSLPVLLRAARWVGSTISMTPPPPQLMLQIRHAATRSQARIRTRSAAYFRRRSLALRCAPGRLQTDAAASASALPLGSAQTWRGTAASQHEHEQRTATRTHVTHCNTNTWSAWQHEHVQRILPYCASVSRGAARFADAWRRMHRATWRGVPATRGTACTEWCSALGRPTQSKCACASARMCVWVMGMSVRVCACVCVCGLCVSVCACVFVCVCV